MEVPTDMVRRSTIQQVRQSRFWNLDRIIRWTLWPYICSVRPDDVVVFLPLTVSACSHFLEQNAAIQNGTHQGNYMHFSFGVKDFDLGFRYFPHFSVLLLSIPRTLAFLYLTLAYA
jgi:hypothetical protein